MKTQRNLSIILVQHHFFIEYFLYFWRNNFLSYPYPALVLEKEFGFPHFMNSGDVNDSHCWAVLKEAHTSIVFSSYIERYVFV